MAGILNRIDESLFVIHLQRGNEGFLRDLHLAELAHALLAGLLLFQELASCGWRRRRSISQVTSLRRARTVSRAMILPPMAAWIGIWNRWGGISSFIFSTHAPAATVSAAGAVDQHGQGVDGLGVDQDGHLHQVADACIR